MCSKVNEKRKSKLLLTLFALGITLTLCGCMKSVELKERTIIRMVGVDVDGQDFVLTMSQFSPQTQSGEKSSSRTQVVQTREARSAMQLMKSAGTAAMRSFWAIAVFWW